MSKTKLWGGRFSKKTHQEVDDFSRSIQFDYKLAEFDCIGSLIHIDILKKASLLTTQEHLKLKNGLKRIISKIQAGEFKANQSFEDIHSYIQYLLENDKSVGKAALKLHTCRSRNDQVVFDTKLYCLYNIYTTNRHLGALMGSLSGLMKKNKHVYIPGYTHLQHAMPVSLADYFDAYNSMLSRDNDRLHNIFNNIKLTMGSGALAGTFIDASKYHKAAKMLLMQKGLLVQPADNSIATVSDRDFVIEVLSTLSIIGMHLSRLSEDMILWASKEFDFIDIDDAFCTGSSMMPQKKNPDVLELVRGYTGRLYGNLINVLVVMKGLPLSYNRDMQHDKEPLFDSFKIIRDCLSILTALFKNVNFKVENINRQLKDESLYATDMADYLVKNGVPFKTAHGIIGKLIQEKLTKNIEIRDMKDDELKKFDPLLSAKILKAIMNPKQSVISKRSIKRGKRRLK